MQTQPKEKNSAPERFLRLDKFLSDSTGLSRAEAKKRIRAGAVTVNGVIVRAPEWKTALSDTVFINRRNVRYQEHVYLMLNKPAGCLSATEDRRDPVVTDLVPEQWKHFHVFPAGRLDKDTEGLLLLTDDGTFAHALTAPRRDVPKRYYAELDGPVGEETKRLFAAGMEFEDFTAKPAQIEWDEADPSKVFITISEGKYHQVKRMCGRAGRQVLYLKRVSVGALMLDPELKPGEMRELTDEELRLVRCD